MGREERGAEGEQMMMWMIKVSRYFPSVHCVPGAVLALYKGSGAMVHQEAGTTAHVVQLPQEMGDLSQGT